MNDSYTKEKAAYNTIENINNLYFTKKDQEGILARNLKNSISNNLKVVEVDIDTAKEGRGYEDISLSIISTKNILTETLEALQKIEDISNSVSYKDVVSSAYKTELVTQKNYINASYTALDAIENNLSLLKDQNDSSYSNAKSQSEIAESNYEAAKSNYDGDWNHWKRNG